MMVVRVFHCIRAPQVCRMAFILCLDSKWNCWFVACYLYVRVASFLGQTAQADRLGKIIEFAEYAIIFMTETRFSIISYNISL